MTTQQTTQTNPDLKQSWQQYPDVYPAPESLEDKLHRRVIPGVVVGAAFGVASMLVPGGGLVSCLSSVAGGLWGSVRSKRRLKNHWKRAVGYGLAGLAIGTGGQWATNLIAEHGGTSTPVHHVSVTPGR